MHTLSLPELRLRLPPLREPRSHKRSFGRLQLIAGSREFPGAARLVALGAFKAGCGYIALDTEKPAEILCDLPEIIPGFFPDFEAAVVGPGLGEKLDWKKISDQLLTLPKTSSVVVDASALDSFPRIYRPGRAWLLTPHEGELARMLGAEWTVEKIRRDPRQALQEINQHYTGVTWLLKGSPTYICSANEFWSMPWGTVAMATAGQGDLLSGVIGAYLANKMAPLDAALVGSSLCALSALDLAQGGEPQGVLAHEVATQFPRTLARLRNDEFKI